HHRGYSSVASVGMISVVLALCGLVSTSVIECLRFRDAAFQIVGSVLMIASVGLFMGTAFPLGMRAASVRAPLVTPWLWGINGAASVCGSVFAYAIALFCGISATFWTGVVCYGVALSAVNWGLRPPITLGESRLNPFRAT
ncbi:MAG: hypothetical protein V2B18_09875, partial [Pseudomonadota bacterium]